MDSAGTQAAAEVGALHGGCAGKEARGATVLPAPVGCPQRRTVAKELVVLKTTSVEERGTDRPRVSLRADPHQENIYVFVPMNTFHILMSPFSHNRNNRKAMLFR